MNRNEREQRTEKWRTAFAQFSGWDTNKQRSIQRKEATVFVSWLAELHLSSYDILEVGCGNGYFGKTVIELLEQRGMVYTYHFSDFLPECVAQAKQHMRAHDQSTITYSVLDVYDIDTTLGEGSQHIIVSTGFASPVTYADVLPNVAAALRPGGILLCDFVNHFSLPTFLSHPIHSYRKWRSFTRDTGANTIKGSYHFGMLGIESFFASHQLTFVRNTTIRLRRNPLLCMFQKRPEKE